MPEPHELSALPARPLDLTPDALEHLMHEPPASKLAANLARRVLERRRLDLAKPIADRYRAVLDAGGLLLFAGLGGYHAGACHMAAELVVRYRKNRAAMRALALGCNPAITSAAGNDISPWAGLARECKAIARRGDSLTVYSTSGESLALLVLADVAGDAGVTLTAVAPEGSPLAKRARHVVPTADQLEALAIDHLVAELLEADMPELRNGDL